MLYCDKKFFVYYKVISVAASDEVGTEFLSAVSSRVEKLPISSVDKCNVCRSM